MIRFDCRLERADFVLDVAFDSDAGITGLIGSSGSGKSTIIQLISGLVRPTRGRIAVDQRVLVDTERKISVPTHRRGIGLVFQDAQLFPHLNVRQNLDYGRYFNTHPPRAIGFEQVVEVLGVGHLLGRAPLTLSGGERQRVAIGRALLTSPNLLLMDEPLSSLDMGRKLEILPFIERLRDHFDIPILYVSHSAEEIARLASRVVKIEQGTVVAIGSPDTVLTGGVPVQGSERFDAVSMITGKLVRFDEAYGVSEVAHPAGTIILPGRVAPAVNAPAANAPAVNASVHIAVRATNVTLGVGEPAQMSIRTILRGRISAIAETGPFAQVNVELDGGEHIVAYVTRLALKDLGLGVGAPVHALIKAVAIDERGVSGMQIV